VVKICRVIQITLNQLVAENIRIIAILLQESGVTVTSISQSLPHILAGYQLA